LHIRIKVSDYLGKLKMTQKQLADITGIRPATISALYHETIKRIEIDHIEKLCDALGCTAGELIEYRPKQKDRQS
jgi:putative transcriptional regulator